LGDEQSVHAWTFRDTRLEPTSFATAMIHLYRGEVGRATAWRGRLDTTTNWTVVTAAAALTFTFGSPDNPHFVVLLVLLLMLNFLYIEARRYRYYVLWSHRVRLMEINFFAAMLVPPFRPSSDWADQLSETLLHPRYTIVSHWEAMGRRFLRSYVWLIALLLVSWGVKLAVHPVSTPYWATMVERAAIGYIPGAWVVIAVTAVYGSMVALAVAVSMPVAWRETLSRPIRGLSGILRRTAAPLGVEVHPQERLATIITSSGEAVASRLMTELGRGVTALEGRGMYTGEARDVLLCAVTDVQVPHLREIVRRADSSAFVVVSRAEEVRGWGFSPFDVPE
jgi:uncharacterized membrane protein